MSSRLRLPRRTILSSSAGLAAAIAAGGTAGIILGQAGPTLAAKSGDTADLAPSSLPPDAAAQFGNLYYILPSGDTTGATDAAAILGALSPASEVLLLPGTFYINSTITIPGNSTLAGCGPATTVQPTSTISGPMFVFASNGSNFAIRDLQIYGGSGTTGSNPATDVFAPGSGASRWWIENIDVNYCNGWILNPNFSAAMHGVVQGVQGTNNSGGIQIIGSNTSGSTGQVAITNVNLQQCQSQPALYLQNVDDISVTDFNCAVAGSAGVPTIHIAGGCQAIFLKGLNAGVYPKPATAGVQVLLIETLGSSSDNTEIDISGSVFQDGGMGIEVKNGSARLRFRGVIAKTNLGTGWKFSGTGAAILVEGCQANGNNAGQGSGYYDVNVSSTAHVGLFSFAYCSSGVTNSLNIASASNNVSNVNSANPGGKSTTGQAANGWS